MDIIIWDLDRKELCSLKDNEWNFFVTKTTMPSTGLEQKIYNWRNANGKHI